MLYWHLTAPYGKKIETEDDKFLASLSQISDNLSDYVASINLSLLGEQLTMPNLS